MSIFDKIKDIAKDVAHTTEDVGGKAIHTAEDVGGKVIHKAVDAVEGVENIVNSAANFGILLSKDVVKCTISAIDNAETAIKQGASNATDLVNIAWDELNRGILNNIPGLRSDFVSTIKANPAIVKRFGSVMLKGNLSIEQWSALTTIKESHFNTILQKIKSDQLLCSTLQASDGSTSVDRSTYAKVNDLFESIGLGITGVGTVVFATGVASLVPLLVTTGPGATAAAAIVVIALIIMAAGGLMWLIAHIVNIAIGE